MLLQLIVQTTLVDANGHLMGQLPGNVLLFRRQRANPVHAQVERANKLAPNNERDVAAGAHPFPAQRLHQR